MQKKNSNVENFFINKNKVVEQTSKARKFIAPINKENTFVWIADDFIYPGKYNNSLCLGIIKNNIYEIIFEDEVTNERSIYCKLVASELLELFKNSKIKPPQNNKSQEPQWVSDYLKER